MSVARPSVYVNPKTQVPVHFLANCAIRTIFLVGLESN